MQPIEKAIVASGGVSALARALRVSGPTVSQWKSGRRPLPLEHCEAIERAALGAVLCEDLRPDVHWLRDRTGRVLAYQVAIAPAAPPREEA